MYPIPTSSPLNGANGMSDMEGKVMRLGASERAANECQIIEDLQAALAQFAEIAADLTRLQLKLR